MKTQKRILIIAAMLFAGIGSINAQDFQTGYFLGGYQYGYRLNPAFQSEHSHAALIFGQLGLTQTSNLGVDNFLFVKDGKTMLFLNDKVSSQEFLGKLNKKENNVSVDFNLNLISAGFWVERMFFNIDLNVRTMNTVSLPYDLFRFLKDGASSNPQYNFAGTGVHSKEYVELAMGWSRNWNNFITGGARLKALVGVAQVNAYFNNLDLTLNKDKWSISAQGTLDASMMQGLSVDLNEDGSYKYETLKINPSKLGPAGYGAALDLGVTVTPLPWLTASVAILDLGFMAWNNEINGTSLMSSYTWEPSQSDPISVTGGNEGDKNPMDQELEKMKAALEGIYKFVPAENKGPKTEILPFRMNVGAELRLPWYDRLSLGLLYSMRNGQGFNWQEGRISLNISPLNWLSLSGSTAFNDFFHSFGFGLNIHPGVINLFFGADVIPGRVISINQFSPSLSNIPGFIGIPASDLNINAYFGLSIAIGRRKVDYRKRIIPQEED